MKAARKALALQAHFIVLPNVMFVSFGSGDQGSTDMRLIKSPTTNDLDRLSQTYAIYKALTHYEKGPSEANEELGKLLDPDREPCWGKPMRCLFGFLTAFLVCPMAFGGSMVDALVSGIYGGTVSYLGLCVATKSGVFSTVFE